MNAARDNHPSRHSGRPSAAKPRPSLHASDAPEGEEALVSRRRFLYGAAGVGAVAAVGIGAVALNAANAGKTDTIAHLKVPDSAMTTLNDLESLEDYEGQVRLVGSFDLPYGTLVWSSDEEIAACLLPTESGSPLTQVGLLHLGSGTLDTVLEQAVGKSDGFEIYDVRANSQGIVWTEANIMEGAFRIYGAPLSKGTVGEPRQLDEGGESFLTPTLGVVGKKAFWQVVPKSSDDREATTKVMSAPLASGEATCILESPRQSFTPLYTTDDSVVVAARMQDAPSYCQLTSIDAQNGDVTDTLVLPQGMKPLEAGYGKTGFMFSFPDIYDYGEGISNLGTYTPFAKPDDGDYSNASWFGFARMPSAAPAWSDGLLIVKSSYSVCGVDLDARTYFAIDVENGADTYGEYLASTGTHDTFVTYTNIDHTPIGEKKVHNCRVKVWKPLTQSERREFAAQQAELDDEETVEA